MSSEYDVNFALFCDGPLNSKLSKDNDETYIDYLNQTNLYGHQEDYNRLNEWLSDGLDATNATKHILEIFKKNHNTFDEYFMIFNNFLDILFAYNPDIEKILYILLSFDDYDDVYPSYLTEYTYDFKFRGYAIDYIYKKNLTFNIISNDEFIDILKIYGDWKNISEYKGELIDEENFLDMYYKILKSKSILLQIINI